uniref:Uncharacterized protein n=1 Tax=Branchiostoma floridae TaxID=7739 RepID=C3ZFN5_BRAFL|eukprot:XP_002592632.1 hypothetical protein BRAFLDRAFT_85080 [Branchiostoma floridae]
MVEKQVSVWHSQIADFGTFRRSSNHKVVLQVLPIVKDIRMDGTVAEFITFLATHQRSLLGGAALCQVEDSGNFCPTCCYIHPNSTCSDPKSQQDDYKKDCHIQITTTQLRLMMPVSPHFCWCLQLLLHLVGSGVRCLLFWPNLLPPCLCPRHCDMKRRRTRHTKVYLPRKSREGTLPCHPLPTITQKQVQVLRTDGCGGELALQREREHVPGLVQTPKDQKKDDVTAAWTVLSSVCDKTVCWESLLKGYTVNHSMAEGLATLHLLQGCLYR